VNDEQPKKSKLTLYAILIVAFLPLVAAYVAYYTGLGVPQETVNAGLLLKTPIKIDELLDDEQSLVFLQDKKWRLLLPLPTVCGEDCQTNFFTTRQVHVRLGNKSNRVERVALNLAGDKGELFLGELKKDHKRLLSVSSDLSKWQSGIKATNTELDANTHYYYLVDQEGFVMMAYSVEQSGGQLLKDLKRVLKYSLDYQS
jgi:hypothetical protein